MAEEQNKNEDLKTDEQTSLKRGDKMSDSNKIHVSRALVAVVVGILALGLAFSAGRATGKRFDRSGGSCNYADNDRNMDIGGRSKMMGGSKGFREESLATVKSIDGDNLAVNLNDKDLTVTINEDTSILKSGAIAKQSDINVNDEILIQGSSKSDGSIVAKRIIIK